MSFNLNFWGFRCLLLKKIFNSLSMVICFAFSLGTFGHFNISINSGGKLDFIFCILRSSQFNQEVYPLLALVHEMHLLLSSIFVLLFLYYFY